MIISLCDARFSITNTRTAGWYLSLQVDKHLRTGQSKVFIFLAIEISVGFAKSGSLLLLNPASFRNNKALGRVQFCFAALIEGRKKGISRNF